jgi:hypothetical protein
VATRHLFARRGVRAVGRCRVGVLRTWREINESEWCEERNDRIAIIACSDARA